MKSAITLALLVAGSMCVLALPQDKAKAQGHPERSDGLTPSKHRPGPRGLEGWTLEGPIPDDPQGKYPFVLVIARNGREIRRFEGDAFVWKWTFVADGRQVAYESGPLHFSLACILAEVSTGRRLATYDCYRELPEDAPEWVTALEDLQ